MSLFSYHPVGGTKPPTGAAGPSDQILRPVPAPPPPEGGGQNLPEARERGWYPVFCVPSRAPRPRRGRGQNLPEAQRKGWYPNFCVPSPRPPPPEGAGAKPPGGPEKRMVSNLCVFFTAWLPNGYQKIWETIGAVGAAKMVISVWLPNGYQGNFFERKGSLFSCFRSISQLFRPMQGALYFAGSAKMLPNVDFLAFLAAFCA